MFISVYQQWCCSTRKYTAKNGIEKASAEFSHFRTWLTSMGHHCDKIKYILRAYFFEEYAFLYMVGRGTDPRICESCLEFARGSWADFDLSSGAQKERNSDTRNNSSKLGSLRLILPRTLFAWVGQIYYRIQTASKLLKQALTEMNIELNWPPFFNIKRGNPPSVCPEGPHQLPAHSPAALRHHIARFCVI